MARFPAPMRGGGTTPSPRTFMVKVSARSSSRAAALLRNLVEVAALELHPVGLEVFRSFEIGRPGGAGHEPLRLPHHVELAVGADFPDEHWLADVMVRQHRGDAAGQVRRLDARERLD